MAKIYLIRHGESIANTEGRYQGQTYNTPLSRLGESQVTALGARFESLSFDEIFTSPLTRTLQTAQAISPKVTMSKEILETNHGHWEGKTKEEIKQRWSEMYVLWKTKPSQVTFPNGEAFSQTAKRSIGWINHLLTTNGTFVVVTHSNIIMAALTYFLNMRLDEIWSFDIQPTSVSLIETKDDTHKVTYSNWRRVPINRTTQSVVRYNSVSHLKGLESDLSKHAI